MAEDQAQTQTPRQAPAAGAGAEGYTGCNASGPVSKEYIRTDFMKITEISLICTCVDIKTKKT